MIYQDKIQDVKEKLRDFQRETVEYLFQRMYVEGQNRMLVADEVGLGKTWIAKGLIAKAFETALKDGPNTEVFNVFYICSNQQLAVQNLRSINFTKEPECIVSQVDRITLMAYEPKNVNKKFRLYALTPDTSFKEYSTLGTKGERLILYSILSTDPAICNDKLSKLLKGPYDINWDTEGRKGKLRDGLIESYTEEADKVIVDCNSHPECFNFVGQKEKMSLLELLKSVVINFDKKPKSRLYFEIIGSLKRVLSKVCLSYMKADIFIMDEFQRYCHLIDSKSNSEASTIAQQVFSQPGSKILMLSATPFKAYTDQIDESNGEQHYREFTRVLRFLYEGQDVDWKKHEERRSRLFSKMLHLKDTADKENQLKEIESLKQEVEEIYSKVIARTERIIASRNPDGMIVTQKQGLLPIKKQDIENFLFLDSVFKDIYKKSNENVPSPMEYAKSAPYAMSFLREYKIGEKAREKNIPLDGNAFVNLNLINKYNFPKDNIWPNSKLQLLMENMKKESHLLWCPPSLSYYQLSGAFKGQEHFTKTLIFSSWKLVPKMIATLVSYEMEKQTLGKLPEEEGIKYFADRRVASQGDKARKPRRRLVFATTKKGDESILKSMTTLLLAYPSKTLEEIVDPLRYVNSNKKAEDIIAEHTTSCKITIQNACRDYGNPEDKEYTHISWSIPILCDKGRSVEWLDSISKKLGYSDTDRILDKEYLSNLKSMLDNEEISISFPKKVPERELTKQARQMVSLALGSPAVCAYRALKRYYNSEDDQKLLSAAFQIGLAFIDLFNKPESISIVDLQYRQKDMDYWQKVIRYCIDGNLQAILDEYIYMLKNEYDKPSEVANTMARVISLRTVNLKVDDSRSFCGEIDDSNTTRNNLRSHYAAAFGINAKSSQGSEVRASNIREAFNSPFKPFILATTSIGQEGLDFHWFCRRIMHWNLPHNPIDFEQREGRINRFKGKVIRQRISDKYGPNLSYSTTEPWQELFDKAETDKSNAKFVCDIVPNWHFEGQNDDCDGIERIVPLYQFSQDIGKYQSMLSTLGLYRLTFGQPRQEELANALDNCVSSEEMERIMINLCPLKRRKQ